jgi:hypothetical protein
MYVGLCAIVIAVLALTLLPAISLDLVMQLGGPERFVKTCFFTVLAGQILHLIGQLLCLAVPRETGAAPALYLSIIPALLGMGLHFLLLFAPDLLLKIFPISWFIGLRLFYIQLACFTFAICLLLLSLRTLNHYVGAARDASRANTAFWATLVFVGLFVAFIVTSFQQPPLGRVPGGPRENNELVLGFSLATLLFGMVWLILYGNTLLYTSKALRAYERRGGQPESRPEVVDD